MGNKLQLWILTFQSVRDDADAVLGRFRPGGPEQLRVGRHQELHALLGHADVRHVLCDQHRGAAEPADRHDEPLVPAHLGKEPEQRLINFPNKTRAAV